MNCIEKNKRSLKNEYFLANEKGVSLSWRNALLIARKRLPLLEKGVSLFDLQQFQPTMYYLVTH